jgi:hypothetical protein
MPELIVLAFLQVKMKKKMLELLVPVFLYIKVKKTPEQLVLVFLYTLYIKCIVLHNSKLLVLILANSTQI